MVAKTFDGLPKAEQANFQDVCAEGRFAREEFNVFFTEKIAGDNKIKTCGRSIVVVLGNTTRAQRRRGFTVDGAVREGYEGRSFRVV